MKQEKLIVGGDYLIKYGSQYCHTAVCIHKAKVEHLNTNTTPFTARFVGTINLPEQPISKSTERNIFYTHTGEYLMFGTQNLDYIASIEEFKLLSAIEKTEKHLASLKNELLRYGK